MNRYFLILFSLIFCFPGGLAAQNTATRAQDVTMRLPWPVKTEFTIGGHIQDFQNYAGVPYFHGGLDVVAPAGTIVYTPVAGKVTVSRYRIDAGTDPLRFTYSRFPLATPDREVNRDTSNVPLYVEVAVTDGVGRTWMFRHLEASSLSPKVLLLDRTEMTLAAGEPLGKIVAWKESVYPESRLYHHLHLEVHDRHGSYLNPVLFLGALQDSVPPVIGRVFLLPNEGGMAFPESGGRPVVSGDTDIVAEITDQTDTSRYYTAPYRVNLALYRVLENGLEPVISSREIFSFAALPIKGDRTTDATVLFKPRVQQGSTIFESQGNARKRYYLMVLSNGDTVNGYDPANCLRTRLWPNGRYSLEITAFDVNGNRAERHQEFEIRN
jgi:hypothetical protein